MKKPPVLTMDGNEAVASVAYRTNELIAIYPITPASTMAEWCDQWASDGRKNLWGDAPRIIELQSEGGAAGTLHGAVQNGMLATTFTASQGLLLMIPNMYKMAGERMPAVIHVAARSLATSALSIFGDHSDVMAVRGTGFGMLFARNVQEAADMALLSQVISLRSTLPFLNIIDGFRTSHEVHKMTPITDAVIERMLDRDDMTRFRNREMSPERPVLRGTSHNPDTFFQIREAVNPWYAATPLIAQERFDAFAAITGRAYAAFEYEGASDAERLIVVMGSGAETVADTVAYLTADGMKVGVLNVRLYRPFDAKAMLDAIPETVRHIAVLDRTKEPGSAGEPLYQDVVTAYEAVPDLRRPRILSGRYGLSSKEFTPGMVMAVIDELTKPAPKPRFTVGIDDDVTHLSLDYDPTVDIEPADVKRAIFWGLGADGTVGANKNSIKIIGEQTKFDAQGYFVYDSKKSGSRTVSHLRFGSKPIRAPYLVSKADFIAVHQFGLLDRVDTLEAAQPGATFLLNSPYPPEQTWDRLPATVKHQIREKRLLKEYREVIGAEFVDAILAAKVVTQADVRAQRERITDLKVRIAGQEGLKWDDLRRLADTLVEPVVWIIGGDGWAYDIGYGGLDHVLAGRHNVNIMVLDTEVYSNTGGQSSKSTGLGAIAKFAAAGKDVPKKDLAKMAMAYGYVYVAKIAMGADENHTLKVIREAVEYDGPSLIIAYGPCIAHGLDMAQGPSQQEKAVKSGYWPLFRFDPRLEKPLQIDSKPPSIPIIEYLKHETRFKRLIDSEGDPEHHELIAAAQAYVNRQWAGLTGP